MVVQGGVVSLKLALLLAVTAASCPYLHPHSASPAPSPAHRHITDVLTNYTPFLQHRYVIINNLVQMTPLRPPAKTARPSHWNKTVKTRVSFGCLFEVSMRHRLGSTGTGHLYTAAGIRFCQVRAMPKDGQCLVGFVVSPYRHMMT